MMPVFDCFVGIDWSGDKEKWQKGLKVAIAHPGKSAPRLVPCPAHNSRWSRTEAVRWIAEQVQRKRVLIGLDFAFGFPSVTLAENVELDEGYVEGLCASDPNFYGGAFFRLPLKAHSHLINSSWHKGCSYAADHLRETDRVAKKTRGATPQSIFNAVGPAQVGPSSISGMRALRALRQSCGDYFAIWPFDEINQTKSVIVEIFPRYLALRKACSARLVDRCKLNAALAAYDSEEVETAPGSEDEGDALLSAAALRRMSREHSLFELPNDVIRSQIRSQGWIFGVPTHDERSS
jgi:hypothetical protein